MTEQENEVNAIRQRKFEEREKYAKARQMQKQLAFIEKRDNKNQMKSVSNRQMEMLRARKELENEYIRKQAAN